MSAGSTIDFNIPGPGIHTINLKRVPLPAVVAPGTWIDGTSQHGYMGSPLIEVNGTAAGPRADGFIFPVTLPLASGIQGLEIFGFSNDGILVIGASPVRGVTIRENVIGGNGGDGIAINGGVNDVVSGNFIGTDATGTHALANGGDGVDLLGGVMNTIGFNVIAGNMGDGIAIRDGSGDVVSGNFIGTNAAASRVVANGGDGIDLVGGAMNTIGGTAAGAANVIAGNVGDGLAITGATSDTVAGNDVGYSSLVVAATVGNGGDGVNISGGATSNAIGPSNGIAFNGGDGVYIAGAGTRGNTVEASTIDSNGGDGVTIVRTASGNLIGGTSSGAGNVIASNRGDGVRVGANVKDLAIDNGILGNSIYSNAGVGIVLGKVPEPHGPATGPNNLQNPPTLTLSASGTTGTLVSTPNTTYRIEFFANPPGTSQGEIFLTFVNVTTNAFGYKSFPVPTAPPPPAWIITATATDPSDNTSYFS